MKLIISVIQSIYIIYMFNFFETSRYFTHPFDVFTNNIPLLDHSEKENHLCLLGNIIGFLLPIWLVGRHTISSPQMYNKYNKIILNSILFVSLVSNMNAFLYFLPLYIIDLV